jgi:hypothetical protein
MTGATADRHLTAEQLAERWQLVGGDGKPKAAHVYRLTRSGQLKVVRLGRYYRYRIDDIVDFEVGGGAEQEGQADA